MSDFKLPSEAVQISAQIFVMEMAKHLVKDKGVIPDEALKISVENTRRCMDRLELTVPKEGKP
jgi:hypothetical protein